MPTHNRKTSTYSTTKRAIAGTRMTPRKITQILDGMRDPSKSDTKKLKLYYDRVMYNTLRAAGAPRKTAQKLFRGAPKKVSQVINKYKMASKKLAEARDTSQVAIQYGLSKSTVTPENLRIRTIMSGLKGWKGVITSKQMYALVQDYLKSGFLVELDEYDVDED